MLKEVYLQKRYREPMWSAPRASVQSGRVVARSAIDSSTRSVSGLCSFIASGKFTGADGEEIGGGHEDEEVEKDEQSR